MNCLRRCILTKQKDFIEKGDLGGEQEGRGTQNGSATWLTVSGFMARGSVSKLCLASHLVWPIFGLTWGPSCWHTHLSAKMGCSVKDSGRLVGRYCRLVSPPSFRPLPNSPGELLAAAPHSLSFHNRTSCCETRNKSLSSCLANVGSFHQWFPNISWGPLLSFLFDYLCSTISFR